MQSTTLFLQYEDDAKTDYTIIPVEIQVHAIIGSRQGIGSVIGNYTDLYFKPTREISVEIKECQGVKNPNRGETSGDDSDDDDDFEDEDEDEESNSKSGLKQSSIIQLACSLKDKVNEQI